MISRETIDEVKSRMDIVDIIGDFITLKRSGQNYKALSPFSNEKTASFYVVPSKGIFKDFSSGKGGDGITFVMEHEGMSYVEAIKHLAAKYGVAIEEDQRTPEQQAQHTDRDRLYHLMQYAKDYYKDLLVNSEEGQSIGLSYFRERGFNDRVIEKFELGYTLNSWDHLSKKAIGIGYTEQLLGKAGLIVTRDDGRYYDRFRGRVIFPIHNLSGKVIAFGARILTKDKDQPKYINSPETEIYHKSNVLYGMFQAKNAIRREDFCYIVEGYTDVIAMHLSDIDNVVASSGTAFTEEQIKLIKRFTQNITVLFDGDAAGIKAALRGIDLVLKGGLNVRIVLLPDGEDPDSYSKKHGSTALKQFLKDNSKDFISFKIDLYATESGHDPIKKAEAIREIVTSISLIPDAIKRSVYLQETSRLLKMQESVLLTELNKLVLTEQQRQHPDEDRGDRGGRRSNNFRGGRDRGPVPMGGPMGMPDDAPPPDMFAPDGDGEYTDPASIIPVSSGKLDAEAMVLRQEQETMRILLNYAENAYDENERRMLDFMLTELEDFEFISPLHNEIYTAFKNGAERGEVIDSLYFMEHNMSDEIKSFVATLTTPRHEASKNWAENKIYFSEEKELLQQLADANIYRLKYRMINKLIEDTLQQLKSATSEEEEEQVTTIYLQLKAAEMELAKFLGIVIGK